jgi:hypothetical protein
VNSRTSRTACEKAASSFLNCDSKAELAVVESPNRHGASAFLKDAIQGIVRRSRALLFVYRDGQRLTILYTDRSYLNAKMLWCLDLAAIGRSPKNSGCRLLKKDLRGEAREKSASGGGLSRYVGERAD